MKKLLILTILLTACGTDEQVDPAPQQASWTEKANTFADEIDECLDQQTTKCLQKPRNPQRSLVEKHSNNNAIFKENAT
ncbi:hypothetical protein [Oligoflexus tunisiensis]|uniref:hypothetical protein n=1 Tax=Oligoflexus tunisiensis TaxID=708132 RepID=UPI000AD5BF48|nr:hypothetical protein [Oligoflexus tunisiensis]